MLPSVARDLHFRTALLLLPLLGQEHKDPAAAARPAVHLLHVCLLSFCAPWYCADMTRLRWSKQRRPAAEYGGGRGRVLAAYTDLVPLADIIGPVCLQPDASAEDAPHFLYNHYVR